MYGYEEDEVPRSVTPADFGVALASFVHNLASSVHSLADDILQIAVYHASRKNKVSEVWEQFAQDLEKMED
jgi:enamine deaminase RidA (YjgF/YER057c/UK114 family)